jgi:secondary thiamine-phosphate synthase enzyme
MVYQDEIEIQTSGHKDMHNITTAVAECVKNSGITSGIVNIFNIGSTAIIGTIEYEAGLEHDLPELLDKLAPPSRTYGHEQAWHDGNGHSHLQASMMGPGITVPFNNSHLLLGTWQQIFHLECDIKPRKRTLILTVIG